MAGDSHTGFNSGAFTAGAVGGSMLLASAMVAGLQAAAQHRRRRWGNWNREQLETAIDLSEALREEQYEALQEERIENARLRAAMRRIAVRPR